MKRTEPTTWRELWNERNEWRTRTEDIEAVLREVLAWLENAPIDYSNGVEHDGLDERRVRCGKIHDALVAKIKKTLERVS